jgi:hypothetical protein
MTSWVALVNADNCYDRISHHTIVSMVFQAFGLPSTAVEAMLTAIQEMIFFPAWGLGTQRTLLALNLRSRLRDIARVTGYPRQDGQLSVFLLSMHTRRGDMAHILYGQLHS